MVLRNDAETRRYDVATPPPPGTPRSLSTSAAAAVVGGALLIAASGIGAQTWTYRPGVTSRLTFTDNVELQPSNSPARVSDWVLDLTPSLSFTEHSAHTKFSGTVGVPVLVYARTGRNDGVLPEVAISGITELYPRVFFVDTSVNVSQQFVSPFGARPIDLANVTGNRLTAQDYRVSPHLKGDAASDLHYDLRDDNEWTVANDASVLGGRWYTNEMRANLTRDPHPFGWLVEYDRNDRRFSEGLGAFVSERSQGQLTWQPNEQWQVRLAGGYEDERYPLENFSGAIYGLGAHWRPTERTNLDARWQHRFFGTSYNVSFDHRTPLTVWSLNAFRDITSYPQQLANAIGEGSVSTLLNALFSSRVTDPLQRQALVDQLIRERNLPLTLNGPLSLVSQQITLEENIVGRAGIIGARNSIVLSAYRTRNEPVTGSERLSEFLLAQENNTQTGASVTWSYRVTPLYTLATTADWSRVVANDVAGLRTKQGVIQSILTAPLSLLTNVFVGARFQWITSEHQEQIHEAAVFIGMSHFFR